MRLSLRSGSLRALAALMLLCGVGPARAEVSPGTTHTGYKVYELFTNAVSVGLAVVVGNTAITYGGTTWAAKSSYWVWKGANASWANWCTTPVQAIFPNANLTLDLQYDSNGGNNNDTNFQIDPQTGIVRGCVPTGMTALSQRPLTNAVTPWTVPSNASDFRWWTAASTNSSVGMAWFDPNGGANKLKWVLQYADQNPCPSTWSPANPAFGGNTITLTHVSSSAVPNIGPIACALKASDVVQ